MPRKRSKVKKVMLSFAVPQEELEDFDKTIEEFNKRNNADFSRSKILQVLVLNYIIETNKQFIKEDSSEDTENKEEN